MNKTLGWPETPLLRSRVSYAMLALLAVLAFATAPPACAASLEFTVRSPLGHDIAAVIETPDSAVPRPTVVLVAGAGAHDRNGFTLSGSRGHNDSFRVLSQHLQERGFAVVRFDEMGTGASGGDYALSATTQTLTADLAALVRALRRRKEVDTTQIALVGHSEGAVISAAVAQHDRRIGALILLAAPAWTGARIMRYQDSVALAEVDALSDLQRSAERGRITAARAREAAQREASEAWYRTFLTLDPLDSYAGVSVPTLIVHGQKDRLVAAPQAGEIAATLRAGGNTRVEVHIFAELGHALVDDEWARVVEPLSSSVLTLLGVWLATTLGEPGIRPGCGSGIRDLRAQPNGAW